jgi:ribosomal protein L37E
MPPGAAPPRPHVTAPKAGRLALGKLSLDVFPTYSNADCSERLVRPALLFARLRPMQFRPAPGRQRSRSVIRSRRARSPDVPDFRNRSTPSPRGPAGASGLFAAVRGLRPHFPDMPGGQVELGPPARSPQVWRSSPCMTSHAYEISANYRLVSVLGGMTNITSPAAGSARTGRPSEFGSLPRATRCECQRCGVHTFPVLRHTVTSRCHNCGSERLIPVTSSAVGPQGV